MEKVIKVWLKYYPVYLSGLWGTLWISAVTVFLGALLGMVVALMRMSRLKILRTVFNVYVEILRGTPILPWDLSALGTAADVAERFRERNGGQVGAHDERAQPDAHNGEAVERFRKGDFTALPVVFHDFRAGVDGAVGVVTALHGVYFLIIVVWILKLIFSP